MKKLFIIILCLFTVTAVLSSCAVGKMPVQSGTESSTEEPSESSPQQSDNIGEEIQCEYFLSWAGPDFSDGSELLSLALNTIQKENGHPVNRLIFKCSSLEELNGFKAGTKDILSLDSPHDEVPSFEDATRRFDTEFFKANSLLLVYMPESSSSYRHTVKSIVRHGDAINVTIAYSNDPEFCDDMMSGWLVIIPISNGELDGVANYDAIFSKK